MPDTGRRAGNKVTCSFLSLFPFFSSAPYCKTAVSNPAYYIPFLLLYSSRCFFSLPLFGACLYLSVSLSPLLSPADPLGGAESFLSSCLQWHVIITTIYNQPFCCRKPETLKSRHFAFVFFLVLRNQNTLLLSLSLSLSLVVASTSFPLGDLLLLLKSLSQVGLLIKTSNLAVYLKFGSFLHR